MSPNLLTQSSEHVRQSAARAIGGLLAQLEKPMSSSDPTLLERTSYFKPDIVAQAAFSEARYQWSVAAAQPSQTWREAERDAMRLQLDETQRATALELAFDLLTKKEE